METRYVHEHTIYIYTLRIYMYILCIYVSIPKFMPYKHVFTMYVHVCTMYVHVKAMFQHIKWITSGTHDAPAQLRLPFHTNKGSQGTINNMSQQDMIQLGWVQPVPASALRSALSGNHNSSCKFSPIHSQSANLIGIQRRTGCAVL